MSSHAWHVSADFVGKIGFLYLAMSFPEVVFAGSFSDVWLLTGGVGMSSQLWQGGMFTATLNADGKCMAGIFAVRSSALPGRVLLEELMQQQLVAAISNCSSNKQVKWWRLASPGCWGKRASPWTARSWRPRTFTRSRQAIPPMDGRCRYQLLGNVLLLVCQQQQRSPLQRWPHHNGRDLVFEGK